MVRARTLAFVAAAAFAGCSHIEWEKNGASTQDFYRAKVACTGISNANTPGYLAMGNPNFVGMAALGNAMQRQNNFSDCMQAEGWVPHRVSNSSCTPHCPGSIFGGPDQ